MFHTPLTPAQAALIATHPTMDYDSALSMVLFYISTWRNVDSLDDGFARLERNIQQQDAFNAYHPIEIPVNRAAGRLSIKQVYEAADYRYLKG